VNPVQAFWLSLRPHQWTKNLVVFAAPALSKHLFERGPLEQSVLGFVIFCALSGTVYLLNDVADLERDRLHPRKRLRPIASGALSSRAAVALALVLGTGSLGLSVLLGLPFLLCAAL
jgi:decaprenyl-phosphate phosphoribosyltransferase